MQKFIDEFKADPSYHDYMDMARDTIKRLPDQYADADQFKLAYNMWAARKNGILPTNRPETVFR